MDKGSHRVIHSRAYKTEGLVLRSIPVMEADRLITVLTPWMGKLKVTVRGARKITSRLGGHLDVFNRVQLSLSRGRTFDVVTGADAIESHPVLKNSLDRIAVALYLMELTDAMVLEGDPHPQAYYLLLDAMRGLDKENLNSLLPRCVEFHLLAETGYLPELRRCLVCGTEVQIGRYVFVPRLGGLTCDMCAVTQGPVLPLSVDALKVLRFFSGTSFAESLRMKVTPNLGLELENVLGAAIYNVLERSMASSAFVEQVQRLHKSIELSDNPVRRSNDVD